MEESYNKTYYREHADKIKQSAHDYYFRHLETERPRRAAYQRKFRKNNLNHCVYSLILPSGKTYIGSCNFLLDRMARHRHTSKIKTDWLLYSAIANEGGWDRVTLTTLKDNISDKSMRLEYEQAYLDKIPAHLSLNQHRAVAE
jgi:hypothetical protein